MQIGAKIGYLRAREGLSQAGLGKAIGATRAAVNAWEMGLSNPNMQSLIDLARYFHVSVDYLLGLDEEARISISSLTAEEQEIVIRLVHYFDSLHRRGGWDNPGLDNK